jgi:hypothetical protein
MMISRIGKKLLIIKELNFFNKNIQSTKKNIEDISLVDCDSQQAEYLTSRATEYATIIDNYQSKLNDLELQYKS